MSEFTCLSCGKHVQGDDSFAGKHVICPECGQSVTLDRADAEATGITDVLPAFPASSNRRATSEDLPVPIVKKSKVHFLIKLAPIGILLLAILTLIGLLAPAVQRIPEAPARVQSANNLKFIGLAMHSFHDTHKRLPFNGNVNAVARDPNSGSWAFQILPFIDQQALFDNPQVDRGIPNYLCEKRKRPDRCTSGPWIDYCINPWLNDPDGAVNAPDRKFRLNGIADLPEVTILAGQGLIDPKQYGATRAISQSTDIFKGGDPALARRSTISKQDTRGDGALNWGGPLEGGTLFVFADGTVRMLPYSTSGGTIRNGVGDGGLAVFLTPAGREQAVFPD